MKVSKFPIVVYVFMCIAEQLSARVISREEALKVAFPDAEIKQSMLFLTEAEQEEAAKISGVRVESALIARYDASQNQKSAGRAYLDTHIVRTKKESLLVILNDDGTIRRIEIVAFLEPPEYIPPDKWYQQFEKKRLEPGLQLKREIHPVTGATLTAQSTTDSARRILAIDQLLQKRRTMEEKKQ